MSECCSAAKISLKFRRGTYTCQGSLDRPPPRPPPNHNSIRGGRVLGLGDSVVLTKNVLPNPGSLLQTACLSRYVSMLFVKFVWWWRMRRDLCLSYSMNSMLCNPTMGLSRSWNSSAGLPDFKAQLGLRSFPAFFICTLFYSIIHPTASLEFRTRNERCRLIETSWTV